MRRTVLLVALVGVLLAIAAATFPVKKKVSPKKHILKKQLPKKKGSQGSKKTRQPRSIDGVGDALYGCPIDEPYVLIEDTPTSVQGPGHANATLIPGLEVRTSRLPHAGLGVWTTSTKSIPCNYEFLNKGVKEHDPEVGADSGYAWTVYDADDGDKVAYYVDSRDPAKSNWLRYVNHAFHEKDQNLEVHERDGHIYYRVIKEIPAGAELLIHYGDDYDAWLREMYLSPNKDKEQDTVSDCLPGWSKHGGERCVPDGFRLVGGK